jgi:teichuronic acid biosynthesis glycosyltransferase TuaG
MLMTASVIMPAYNAEKTITESVRSVLSQTFTDFELIITDDCSSDGTPDLCKGFAKEDRRVRMLRNAKNMGAAAARNLAINEARGEWIAFLDSDDLWLRDKLKLHLDFIEETGADISYTASAFIGAGGAKKDYILRAERKLTYGKLLCGNIMSCSSVMVRRSVMKNHPFKSGGIHEDYASWLSIVKETGAAYGLDEPLLIYRASRNSRSGRLIRSGMMSYRTYRAVGFGAVKAMFRTLRYIPHSLMKRVKIRRLK